MKRTFSTIAILVVLIAVGAWYLKSNEVGISDEIKETDHKALVNTIEGMPTQYFGNEVKGDFNKDGMEDVAFLVTANGGGSGTFYYIVAALKTEDGYKASNAILLGDRIAPQTTEFREGEIIVNYADRKTGEPFTTLPSVGTSKYFYIASSSSELRQK